MTNSSKLLKYQPGFADILDLIKTNLMSNINCHNIGRILEFDPVTQTCTVELQQIKEYNTTYFMPVPITDVPLIIYGAGGGHITLPDPTGSICLLLFMDRNIDAFLETGEMYTPSTTRMHDFTDCIALTTFKTLANPIADYDMDSVTIGYQNSTIKVKDEVKINAKNDITFTSVTKEILDAPMIETTGNFSVATGYSGVIPCGGVLIQVTNGIITGVS